MVNTIIIYEGKYGTAKKTAEIAAYIIGNTKFYTVNEAPVDLKEYQNIVIVFSFYGYNTLLNTKKYIKNVKAQLVDKKVGVLGIGIMQYDFEKYLSIIRNITDKNEDISAFVQGELRIEKISYEDRKALEMFCTNTGTSVGDIGEFKVENAIAAGESLANNLKRPINKMDREQLKTEIKKFILSHNTCALSTGSHDEIRCTPLEYQYYNDCFYIITEGGTKFKGLLQNSNVSMGIYDKYISMSQINGMQISGKAEIVPTFCEEYRKVLEEKGFKPSMVKQLPINLYLIKVIPYKFEFLSSDFKKSGYDSKQVYIAK